MTRTAGHRGLITPRRVNLPYAHTLKTVDRSELVPTVFDASYGFRQYLSLGNAPSTGLRGDELTINGGNEVGDCFFAAIAHGLVTKALIQQDGEWVINPEYAPVINLTADHWVGLYLGFQNQLAPGKTATSGPDNGTEPTAGFQWLQQAGIIKRWGLVAPSSLNEGTYDNKGVLLACALDADAETEFEDHQAWKNLPQATDPIEGGHAIYRVGYTPLDGIEITWGADQQAERAWENQHIQQAYWFQAPWEPDPAGTDFTLLDTALAAL